MSLFINVLADNIHLLKILIICNMFFAYQKRYSKNYSVRLVIASIIMSVTSVIIYVFDNHYIETFIYIIVIILLIHMLYKEKIYNIIILGTWSLFALSMIYTMTSALCDMIKGIFNVDGGEFHKLVVSFISLTFVYVIGRVYKKNAKDGMKSI